MSQEEQPSNDQNLPGKAPRRRLRPVDLSKVGKKMQIILEREINYIFDQSSFGPITEASHKKFLNYLKFLPELRERENEDLDDLSDEELENLLSKTSKKGENT